MGGAQRYLGLVMDAQATMGFAKCSTHPTNYADRRTALSTSVLPSEQIAPGTLWLEAITVSKDFSIQLQSSSVMVSGGNSGCRRVGASAALRYSSSEFGALEVQKIAQNPEQWHVVWSLHRIGAPVDVERYHLSSTGPSSWQNSPCRSLLPISPQAFLPRCTSLGDHGVPPEYQAE
jgi:hypothetical protein